MMRQSLGGKVLVVFGLASGQWLGLAWPQVATTGVIQVNETSVQYQAPSAVAIDEHGRVLVDFRDAAGFPLEQVGRFIELDSSLSAEFALGPADGSVGDSSILSQDSGGWLYSAFSYPPFPLAGPIFQFLGENGSAVGPPISIQGPSYTGYGSSVALGPSGDVYVGFTATPSSSPGSPLAMYFERFSQAGSLLTSPARVSSSPSGEIFNGKIAANASGHTLVSWGEYGPETEYDVRARLVDRNGASLTPVFSVTGTTAGWQLGPTGVIAVGADRFVVLWEGESTSLSASDVFFRVFDANGIPLGPDTPVSNSTTLARYNGSITTDGDARFVVSWVSDGQAGAQEEIYFRVFRADGSAAGEEVRASADAGREAWEDNYPFVALSRSGSLAIAWSAGNFDVDSIGVAARKYFRGCREGAERLALQNGRFEVCAIWTSFSGDRGSGVPVQLTPDTGGFWFFSPTNLEAVVKILDGCGLNGHFWLYAAGLTNVEVTLGVIDTWTGETWIRDTNLASPFPPLQDIEALSGCSAVSPSGIAPAAHHDEPRSEEGRAFEASLVACEVDDLHACLQSGRFRVSANFETAGGSTGAGVVHSLGSESVAFWFFDPDNLEVFVKVLDACAEFDRYWVFSAGLTNLFVRLRVEDTETGAFRVYENALNQAFEPILDTQAFRACPQGR